MTLAKDAKGAKEEDQKTFWCREPELNRHGPFGARDFKSRVSTRFHHPGTHEVISMDVTIPKIEDRS